MPPLNTRQRQPIAAFWYLALAPLLFALVIVGLSLGVVAMIPNEMSGFVFLFALIVSGIILAYPILFFLLFSYEIHEHSITINSGIIFRQYETISFNKIQTIDNERGPLLMLFGLTIVEIWTASWDQLSHGAGEGSKHIKPRPDSRIILRKDDANALREYVMRTKSSHSS